MHDQSCLCYIIRWLLVLRIKYKQVVIKQFTLICYDDNLSGLHRIHCYKYTLKFDMLETKVLTTLV
jgi:hypothetical protein